MQKKAIVAYIKLLSEKFPGRAEEKYERKPVALPKFESRTSEYKAGTVLLIVR
jgi:hypothetical protein